MNKNKKLIRITTVPISLKILLPGQMNFMKENGFDVVMISADGPEVKEVVEKEGCRHIVVPMTRKITPVKDLVCLWQLIKIFKKEKPDIVHTHTPKAGLLGMMAAKVSGVKIRIHTVAGLPLMVETGLKFQLLKFIEKLTYASANHVWPNSFSLLKYINEQKLTNKNKLKVISRGSSNGINLNRFDAKNFDEKILISIKESINHSPTNRYILFIGRLVKDKGIVELINTFLEVQKKEQNVKLILVGTFEKDLDLLPIEIMNEIESNKNIIHINWSSHVEYYLSLATIFVFPSHREGFPNVLLQAGAMQLPIICSEIAGSTDIVQDKLTGLFFPVEENDKIKKQILFAINNNQFMLEMAKNLKDRVFNFYRQEKIWNSILEEYKILLNQL